MLHLCTWTCWGAAVADQRAIWRQRRAHRGASHDGQRLLHMRPVPQLGWAAEYTVELPASTCRAGAQRHDSALSRPPQFGAQDR